MQAAEYLYTNRKDNRAMLVIKDGDKITSKSYPRVIMERHLGRKLSPNEDVHHIDGDVTNNDIDNLTIIPHGEHQRQHKTKYTDKMAICQVCGKEFLWTTTRQRTYYIDKRAGRNRIISCSKKCSCYFGKMVQLNRTDEIDRIQNSA